MKGKLIKTEFGYKLNDENGVYIASEHTGKLSNENCEAIANGYDLDELVKKEFTPSSENKWGLDNWSNEVIFYSKEGFVTGFKKAIEILGEKRFSEEDVLKELNKLIIMPNSTLDTFTDDDGMVTMKWFEQYLKQTEFDVEIEMTEDWYDGFKEKPKLDENGCLILKPIKNI